MSASQRSRRDSTMRVEHRLQICDGERLMTLEHIARRGLLLERLLQLRSPRLHLLEQPHILDRDHRLVGEGLDELDLLIGERPDGSRRSGQ